MMTKTYKLLICLLLGCGFMSFAQLKTYNFKRPLQPFSNEWHTIALPDDVFEETNNYFSDLRIYGITDKKDTIEAPYLLRINSEKISNYPVRFDVVNSSKTEDGYYFTFKATSAHAINNIVLNFDLYNFDWLVDLEGSTSQNEWFTLLEDYRILSIDNNATNFKFTTLSFPDAEYSYFRLLVKSEVLPEFRSAELAKVAVVPGAIVQHPLKNMAVTQDKDNKTTTIDLSLPSTLPLSSIKVHTSNTFDYYRSVDISYLYDSIKTEKGWKVLHGPLTSGTLNSLDKSAFKFNSTRAKTIKIKIYNADNQPLDIDSVSITGYKHDLVARFTVPGNYVLAYGKDELEGTPNYDISRFEQSIPEELSALTLGERERILHATIPQTKPLFESKYWLWVIMGIIVIFLGGFMFKMLKNI